MIDEIHHEGRCLNHEDRKAVGKCSECGAYICNSCGYFDGKKIICKECISKKFGASLWEERFAGGGFKGFFITLWRVMVTPTRFFINISRSKAIASALLFAVICEFVGTLGVLLVSNPGDTFVLFLGIELTPQLTRTLNISILLTTPLLALASVFLLALIYQGLGTLFGGKGEFIPTLKVVAYASAASLIQFIPFVGGYLSLFYTLILYTKGIAEVHKLTGFRAGAVAVLPIMVLLLILSIFGTVIFTSLAGNFTQLVGGSAP